MRKAVLLIFGLTGAVLLSQFPEFIQQYSQRLGGHLNELNIQVSELDSRAEKNGKERAAYIRHLIEQPDDAAQREGRYLLVLLARQERIAKAHHALVERGGGIRMFAFVENFDWPIVDETLKAYKPALPFSGESALFSVIGFVAGAAIYGLFFGLRRRRKPVES